MKIGRITLDGYFNYGNVLQNFALNKVLEKYADEVETLWYSSRFLLPEYWLYRRPWNLKSYVKFFINWRGFRDRIVTGFNDWEVYRDSRIKYFCDKNIKIKYVNDLASESDSYDFFVTGSDQVWNPAFADLHNTFLSFTSYERRLSYAASIAAPVIPSEKREIFLDGFNNMAHISVREADGARLIKELTGREAQVHVDPTLLLTADDWEKLEEKPQWLSRDQDYIVTYFLGKRPDDVLSSLSQKYNLPVINILDEKVFEHYTVSPEEWLYLIHHAKLMYTDSFHGTVFSILFRTPFVVCNRIGSKVTEGMTSRIDTLLDLTGIESRRGTADNGYEIAEPLSMNWSADMEDRLNNERKRSHEYLKSVLV